MSLARAQKTSQNTHTLAIVMLWSEEFDQSYEKFTEWLNDDEALDAEQDVTLYLILLLAKGQLYAAKKFFEMPDFVLKGKKSNTFCKNSLIRRI